MRRAVMCMVAAVLGGGLAISQARAAGQARPVDREDRAEQQAQPQLPDGFQLKNLDQIDNIRSELANVVQYAVTPKDFGKLIGQLAVVNRDRMKDYKNQDFSELESLISQINRDWNQKYGHDFNIKKADNVFTDQYTVVQGVVTAANVAAANFPVPANREAQLASAKQRAHEQEGQAEQVMAKDLQGSKGVALVRFPAGEKLPGLTASMIEEGRVIGSWYLVLPASASSQQIHTQLQNELSDIGRNVDKWPADETLAYRHVAHRVVMALYNVNAPESGHERQR